MANWSEKVPQVALPRLEDIFPEIWQKKTVHIAQTDLTELENMGRAGSLLTTFLKKTGVQSKESPPTRKTEKQQPLVRENLVLQAIAANKNKPLYNPHVCPACNMTLKNKGRLMMHLEMHFSEKKLENTSSAENVIKKALGVHNTNASGRQYLCNFCSEVYMNEKDLIAHKAAHFSEQYGCPVCDLTFRTAIYLNIHIESVHCFEKRRKSSEKKSPVQSQSIKRKSDASKLQGNVKALKQN